MAGLFAGAMSSGICNPTDLVKVRMQAQSKDKAKSDLLKSKFAKGDYQYNGIFDAFRKIVQTEGFLSLYTGVFPTMLRAAFLASAEMAVYDTMKSFLVHKSILIADTVSLYMVSALCASFCSAFASNPFDMAKSRLMSQPKDEKGKGLIYTGTVDCLFQSVQQEGFFVLWTGVYILLNFQRCHTESNYKRIHNPVKRFLDIFFSAGAKYDHHLLYFGADTSIVSVVSKFNNMIEHDTIGTLSGVLNF